MTPELQAQFDPMLLQARVFYLALGGLPALFGLALVMYGAIQIHNPQSRFALAKARRANWLHEWIPTLQNAAPEQQLELFNQVSHIQGGMMIGVGVGLSVGGAILVAFNPALVFVQPPAEAPTVSPLGPLFALLLLFCAAGVALGFRYSVWMAQRARPLQPDAAWQPRRRRDYRAAWLDWLLVVMSCGITVIALATIFYTVSLPPGTLPWPPTQTDESILAWRSFGPMLGPVLSWVTTALIVQATPCLTAPDSVLVNEAEDYVRAQVLSLTFSCAWIVVALPLGSLGWGLFGPFAYSVDPPEATPWWTEYAPLLQIAFMLISWWIVIASGLSLLMRGRLGGRRTGWPWRPRLMGVPPPAQSRERLP